MKLISNIQKERLNNFLSQQQYSQFLQAWEWGELAEKEGVKVIRVGVEDDGELVAVATLIKKSIFGFNYFFCPRGPIVGGAIVPKGCGAHDASREKKEKLETTARTLGSTAPCDGDYGTPSDKVIKFLFEEIEKLAKNEKVIFLRFEPKFKIQNSKLKILRSIDIEPSKTAIVNLQKTEEELLNSMHQKTRYNIRLAEKKGVTVRTAGAQDFESFWRIMKETEERDGFRLHDKKHYQQMLALDDNFIKLFLAEYNGKVAAAVLASFFGDMITYIHGASADEDRNVMAPYLLHWQIMKIGQEQGYKYYDLNGVDEKKWPGVTRFKMGFGGEAVEYPGTFDLILDKKMYNIYKVLRSIRRRF